MFRLIHGSIPLGLLVLVVNVGAGSPPQVPLTFASNAEETWETVAREQKLTDPEIKRLREQKFLVTGQALRQVFVPYTGSRVPVFITSDSILNAYHVLFEESIYRMELAISRQLPGVLDRIVKNLDAAAASFKGDDGLIAAAKTRAAIFLGVAQNLLDESKLPSDAKVKTAVQEEVKRIVAGRGMLKPAWLGQPDEGFLAIDYSRFTPRGFYTRTPGLQRYFRAVAWLQAIPFRRDIDEEFGAFLVMHRAWYPDEKSGPDGWHRQLWYTFHRFLGDRDDWDLTNAWELPKEMTKAGLNALYGRYSAENMRGRPQINDQLRFAPTEAGAKTELAFRFLPAYRLPDAVMFTRTMSVAELKRDLPSGLEVAAALGSPLARNRLLKDNPKLLEATDACKPLFKGSNLYADYLRCLGTLMEEIEPDAPKFMRNEPWRIKTTLTALGGWAQMRHTWALQAKVSVMYLSSSHRESGYVEPVPEFYGKLAKLVDDTAAALRAAGALNDDPKELLEDFREDVRAAQAIVKRAIENKTKLSALLLEERKNLARFEPFLGDDWENPQTAEETVKQLERLQRVLAYWEKAGLEDRDISELLSSAPIAPSWNSLSKLSHRLEVLAHKQLRQVPFNRDEDKFFLDYGTSLAGVMFYGGNSYSSPMDDAMRVVDVYSNRGQHLHIGIARPRVMWVLYPTANGEVLCRGAVVPYAEFASASRLTDGEWKSLLDSPKRPGVPAWARPVISPERSRDR